MAEVDIRIIKSRITNAELRMHLGHPFEEMVKFVVDLQQRVVAIGGELHADAEELLLQAGSVQENLWGGNIYPDSAASDRLEYTALINIRPSQDNRSMLVQSEQMRDEMREVVASLIELEGS